MVETKKEKRFHFALSFSGSHRKLALDLKAKLDALGFSVFYDRDFEHEVLGKDGTPYFRRIYTDQSQFCLVFVSEDYDKGNWTILERQFIQDREFCNQEEVMIAVMTSSYRPSWLRSTQIFFDLEKRSLDELAELLKKKLPIDKDVTAKVPGFLDYKVNGEEALTGINDIYSNLFQSLNKLDQIVTNNELIQSAFNSGNTRNIIESLSVVADLLSVIGKIIDPGEITRFVKQASVSYPMYIQLSDFIFSQTEVKEIVRLQPNEQFPSGKMGKEPVRMYSRKAKTIVSRGSRFRSFKVR